MFAHRCEWQNGVVIVIHNLTEAECTVTLDLSKEDARRLVNLLDDQMYEPTNEMPSIQLEGYGYR